MRTSTVIASVLAGAVMVLSGCTPSLDSASQAQVDQLLQTLESAAEKADAAATTADTAAKSATESAERAAAAAQKADAILYRVRQ